MAIASIAVLIAEGFSLDSLTGRVTIFNMLDRVTASTFPAVMPKLYVITIYEVRSGHDPFRLYERVSIRGPVADEGRPILESVAHIATLETHRDARTHYSSQLVSPLPLLTEGQYSVCVDNASAPDGPWSPVGERRFDAILIPPPEAQLVLPISRTG